MATTPLKFTKTSELDNATSVNGEELVRVIQGGNDVKATVASIARTALTNPVLEGLSVTNDSAVAATDNVLQAIGKLQAKTTTLQNATTGKVSKEEDNILTGNNVFQKTISAPAIVLEGGWVVQPDFESGYLNVLKGEKLVFTLGKDGIEAPDGGPIDPPPP